VPISNEPFDVANLVRRARRNADLSQRDLASAIGVSPSTIARAETDGTATLPVLMAALAQGGIELAAIDEAGDQVIIMRPDALRDRAGRQLPAHLDAWITPTRECDPRRLPQGATPPPVRYAKRRHRDERRARHYDSLLYHPAAEDIAIARRREAEDQPVARTPWPTPPPLPECTCSDECVELGMACPPSCPCQCEAAIQATG